MIEQTRRVISGIKDNQSVIISDEEVLPINPFEIFPSLKITNLFYTEDNPQSIQTQHLATPYNINLPSGALRFLKLRMPTIKEIIEDLSAANQAIPEDWTKFNLHSTSSVDYIYILSGKINYVAGKKVIELNQGDFLAQISPEHTWINANDEPCYLLCVAVGIKS